jgi:hypothetical protein
VVYSVRIIVATKFKGFAKKKLNSRGGGHTRTFPFLESDDEPASHKLGYS